MILAEGVTYRAGAKELVAGVTIGVPAGRFTAIVGPNGAGKSTLVKLLSGEVRPHAGSVAYEGEAVRDIPAWRLACLRAVLPQASRLAFPFSVREVVRIGVDGIGRGLTRSDRAGIVAEALARADVAHLIDRSYQTLSGGEQQRVQFGRILAQLTAGRTVAGSQALLLDEPLTSLDLKHQIALLDAATSLAGEGVAVLAVLHDLNLAAAFADSVAVMAKGRMVAQGTPAEVINDRIVGGVFEVALTVGDVPIGDRPFVLPRRSPPTQSGTVQ